MRSYQDLVTSQRLRNPCLANLDQFLQTKPNNSADYAVFIEFSTGQASPQHHRVKVEDLPQFCHHTQQSNGEIRGRILILEDLDASIIDILGCSFDLNPTFFASHIHAPRWENSFQTPEVATLPSRLKHHDFVNIHYHRSVVLHDRASVSNTLTTSSNVRRKVSVLPHSETWPFNKGGKVALVQQCCSVYAITLPDQTWLSIFLVDKPLNGTYISNQRSVGMNSLVQVPTSLFLDGYEDFIDPPSVHCHSSPSVSGRMRRCLLEDVLSYMATEQPPFFSSKTPNTFSLSYIPLRIIAAEWAIFLTLMSQSIKQVEYSIEDLPTLLSQLDRLKADMHALQRWRRRTMSTLRKVSAVMSFLKYHHRRYVRDRETQDENEEEMIRGELEGCEGLIQDFEHIANHIAECGRRLENTLPIIPSLIQLTESRLSLREAGYVRRLTYLALVFVPLSTTAGLFSMDAPFLPGGPRFWVYVAVSVPTALLVFGIAWLSEFDGIMSHACKTLKRMYKAPE